MASKEVEFDLDDFDFDEIVEYVCDNAEFIDLRLNAKIKRAIRYSEENYVDEILGENELYCKLSRVESLTDAMKLEVILENLDKLDYSQICDIFEK
jgi:hypothetical protein